MYKVGDNVETPLGVGVIKWIDKASKNEDEGFDTIYVSIKHFPEIEFNERHIKPYRTAHEKLIELGFNVIEDNEAWIIYELKDEEHVIRFCKGSKRVGVYYGYEDDPHYHLFDRKLKTYGLTKPIEVELAHIIVQYLEELKGE